MSSILDTWVRKRNAEVEVKNIGYQRWHDPAKRMPYRVRTKGGRPEIGESGEYLPVEKDIPMSVETAKEIEQMEQEGFAKYGGGTSQGWQDIRNDSIQPGALWHVATDKATGNKIGYISGYHFNVSDDAPDEEQFTELLQEGAVTMYTADKPMDLYGKIAIAANENKIHYINNLFVTDKYGLRNKAIALNKLLNEHLKKAKEQGAEYIIGTFMSDSYNLLFKNDEVNKERMDRYGVELLMKMPDPDQAGSTWMTFKIK